jgi:hypothetical protein
MNNEEVELLRATTSRFVRSRLVVSEVFKALELSATTGALQPIFQE